MNGKGDKRRPCQISRLEADLRYELAFCKDSVKKQQIMLQLEKLKIQQSNADVSWLDDETRGIELI